MVTIGINKKPICVPGNSTVTVLGKLSKLVKKGSYIVELAVHNNLPSGVVVNCCYTTPKAGQVSVILINTTSRNNWICQPLLAAEIFEVELHPWQYKSVLQREGNTTENKQDRGEAAYQLVLLCAIPLECVFHFHSITLLLSTEHENLVTNIVIFLGFYWIYISQMISSRDIVTESQFLKMSEVLDTNSPKKAYQKKEFGILLYHILDSAHLDTHTSGYTVKGYDSGKYQWLKVSLCTLLHASHEHTASLGAAHVLTVTLNCYTASAVSIFCGNTIKVGFQPIVPPEVEGGLQTNQVEVKVKEQIPEENYNTLLPSFGPCPDTTRIIILKMR